VEQVALAPRRPGSFHRLDRAPVALQRPAR
jgi:hypothetical protein